MKKIVLLITLISVTITQAQIVNIPDANFKNALIEAGVDTNNDGEIQVSEAESVSSLDLYYKDISSLTGIEAFTNLTSLDCTWNQLETLDISNNTALTYLDCSGNYQLETLDISNNTALTRLYCFGNQLETLDISNNTALTDLDCSFNVLETLDISNNTALTDLNCSENYFWDELNLSNNTALTDLDCSFNLLGTLDISNNTALTYLDCSDNQLETLDVSNNTALTDLNCGWNQLETLDLSNNTALTDLDCSDNQLETLDLSNNTALTHLDYGDNNLPNVDLSNLTLLTHLYCSNTNTTSLDLSNNLLLTSLGYSDNDLPNYDISNLTELEHLFCYNTNSTVLNLSNNIALETVWCHHNELNEIDVSVNTSLQFLKCANNLITELDVSNNPDLYMLNCQDNPNLAYINLKNGNNDGFNSFYSHFENLPALSSVCIDEIGNNLMTIISEDVDHSVTFTQYCSLEPAQSNTIDGNIKLDLDNNGCDSSDLPIPNLMLLSNNGTDSFATFTQTNGDYLLYTNEGSFTTQITTSLPAYFTVNPSSQTNTFTGFDNMFTADFCLEPNQTVNDVNINLVPINQARPGFNTNYQIVYKNVGTTPLNGNVTLAFDDTKLSFLNASETVDSQTSNSLTFDYSALNPFETRTIDVTFNVFAPPTVEIGDVLSFTATINPITGDYTPDDNVFILNQTVVGSYDPNDITCLEGNQILLADADKYLHYIIRFQNTGTASAINVVVANELDANLDGSTLQIENISHANRVAIENGNEVEFIFENINLPDSTTDEPNSHGFIAYKIKPKATIALGDVIPNKANIFFDYNEAVETNTVTTEVVNVLAVNDDTLLNFSVYPTPTENILNISSKTEINKIEIYSNLGQLILKNTKENTIDISNLTQGFYFVKVKDIYGNFGVRKIVKE